MISSVVQTNAGGSGGMVGADNIFHQPSRQGSEGNLKMEKQRGREKRRRNSKKKRMQHTRQTPKHERGRKGRGEKSYNNQFRK